MIPILLLAGSFEALPACRDCATGAPGGPADNRLTVFDNPSPQLFVNTATLNLYLRVVDLALGGPGPALSLERSYNAENRQAGLFGNGWTFNLGETLTQDPDSSWRLRRGSGRIDRFGAALDPSRPYFPITSTSEILTRNADGTFTLRGGGSPVTRVFAADGALLAIRDGSVPRATLEYDAAGRLAAARSRGRVVSFAYDDGGRISAVTDSAGRSIRYSYDDQGNLVQQTGADGQTVSYSYDGNGLLTAIVTATGEIGIAYGPEPGAPGVAALSLPDGTTRRYSVARVRTIQVVDGAGNVTTYGSTALGATASVTDPAGNRTGYDYDAMGRRIQTTTANGDTLRFGYDDSGNLTAITDAMGNRWTAEYDAANRLTAVADANRNVYAFQYDAAGNLLQIRDPLNGVTSVARDASGLITALTDANGNQNQYQYDAGGMLTRWTDALSNIWTFRYDGAGRTASRAEPNGSTFEAEYDVRNRLSAVSSGGNRVAFDYNSLERDWLNRVVKSVDAFGNQLTYAYAANGRLASIALPSGGAISYDYDAAGRLARVSDWLGNFAIYRYDATGLVTSLNTSGGPVTVYQYDRARNLIAMISTGAGGDAIAGYRYSLDANANRVAVSALETSPGMIPVTGANLNYNAANNLIARDDGQTYRYDPSGNLTGIEGSRAATLAYDPFGRLQSFNSAQYTYDTLGLRVQRDSNGDSRRFVYDLSGARPRLVMETDGSGAPLNYYVHGLGLLWKVAASSGKTYFYHFDGDGNVVAVSDPAMGVVNRYRYDPLGRLIAADEGVDNPFRARGEAGWIDDGNGLHYAGGSFYLAEIQRALRASVVMDPPWPALAPQIAGAGACFVQGVGECAFAAGRREQR